MTDTNYRLGRFVLVEHESGALRFTTHAALGMERSGNCYVLGGILAIGPWRREEHGNLIDEFHEQRERLPPWKKTEFFCLASVLADTATGHPATEELLGALASGAGRATSVTPPSSVSPAGIFRLGSFRILVSAAGEISWQSCSGSHCLAEGPCRVESGVLFLGTRQRETGDQDAREFHDTLAVLPRWDRTALWCRSLSSLISTTNPAASLTAPAASRPAAANGRQEPGCAVPDGSGKERAQPLAASLSDAFGRRCRESCPRIITSAATPRGKEFWLTLMAAGLLIAAVLGGYAAWELPHDKHSAHKNRNHH